MSRRTEIAHKAQFSDKSAQHDEAMGLGDRVNATVRWLKLMFAFHGSHPPGSLRLSHLASCEMVLSLPGEAYLPCGM